MALTNTTSQTHRPPQADPPVHRPRIWVLQYGPCWCRSQPDAAGSFDFVRCRTADVEPETLDRSLLILSDRVIVGSGQIVRQVYESVPAPKMVIVTGHCPAAGSFWDELPGGWTTAEEMVPVDVRIPECFSGYPEILLATVLDRLRAVRSHGTSPGEPEESMAHRTLV